MINESKLMDFLPEIESLNLAFRDVRDALAIEDVGMRDRVHDILTFLWKALSPEYEFLARYDVPFRTAKEAAEYRKALEQVREIIIQRDSEGLAIWSAYVIGPLRDYVDEVLHKARGLAGRMEGQDSSSDASQARRDSRLAEILLREMTVAETAHLLHREVERAKVAAAEAESAAQNAKTAAGMASGSKLSSRFAALSANQLRSAAKFRWLATVAVLLGILGTYLLAFPITPTHASDPTVGEAIIRVSLLAGVLGLATYFGRQAGYHRDLGTWAKTIEEQLLTFDGYMEPVHDEKLLDAMRVAFAARVFGPTPESKEDSGITMGSSFSSTLLEMFGRSGVNTQR